MSWSHWFTGVKKYTLKVYRKEVWRALEKDGLGGLLLSNQKNADYFRDHGLPIGDNIHPTIIIPLMIKEKWISPSWLRFKEEFFNDKFFNDYVFRGISHFDGAAYKRLLHHGNDRFVKDGIPLAHQSRIMQETSLSPGDFIWGSIYFSKALVYTTGENIRFICVYNRNKLTDISGSRSYAWRLAPGIKSWKDALVAVIVFVFKEK